MLHSSCSPSPPHPAAGTNVNSGPEREQLTYFKNIKFCTILAKFADEMSIWALEDFLRRTHLLQANLYNSIIISISFKKILTGHSGAVFSGPLSIGIFSFPNSTSASFSFCLTLKYKFGQVTI